MNFRRALSACVTVTAIAFAAPSARADSTPTASLSVIEIGTYTRIFDAIDDEHWTKAAAAIDIAPAGPMTAMARAELFLAARSPTIAAGPLLALLDEAPWLPHAARLASLAEKRGATMLPALPEAQHMVWLGSAPTRNKPRNTSDSAASAIASRVLQLIKDDNPAAAESLVEGAVPAMSDEARAEWRQRVAWSYYIENDDQNARRLATLARKGTGEWVGHADWVLGLASWRLRDFAIAEAAFDRVTVSANNDEMRAAAYYWSSRASTATGQAHKVQAKLQTAAQFHETMYGILAAEALGIGPLARRQAGHGLGDWTAVANRPNVQIAMGLVQMGRTALADEVLKHEAKIGGAEGYAALSALSRRLGLAETQLYLGQNGPAGVRPDSFARYPSAGWTPQGGWRVEQSLIFAHTLQESRFQRNAQSPAGARGLMQVMPATARGMAAKRGGGIGDNLFDPATNLEYGQSYLEILRDLAETDGLLPKVMAAYNAGPTPIGRWKTEVRDMGDPLLFIESIPYHETRNYVGTVLRNYWMYEQQTSAESKSRVGMAQNMWPRFPGLAGPASVRMNDPYREDRLAAR